MKKEEKQVFLFAIGGTCACFGLSALYHVAVSETYANSAPLVNKNSSDKRNVVPNSTPSHSGFLGMTPEESGCMSCAVCIALGACVWMFLDSEQM